MSKANKVVKRQKDLQGKAIPTTMDLDSDTEETALPLASIRSNKPSPFVVPALDLDTDSERDPPCSPTSGSSESENELADVYPSSESDDEKGASGLQSLNLAALRQRFHFDAPEFWICACPEKLADRCYKCAPPCWDCGQEGKCNPGCSGARDWEKLCGQKMMTYPAWHVSQKSAKKGQRVASIAPRILMSGMSASTSGSATLLLSMLLGLEWNCWFADPKAPDSIECSKAACEVCIRQGAEAKDQKAAHGERLLFWRESQVHWCCVKASIAECDNSDSRAAYSRADGLASMIACEACQGRILDELDRKMKASGLRLLCFSD
jgi:hypothetical protein